MPNINTANFSLTGMGQKRSFGTRIEDRWISVKDFNAKGDGIANDTAAIQATFDYAFGPESNPNGSADFNIPALGGVEGYTDKVVFFPKGDYRVTSTLALNLAFGVHIIGAGSYQTRIFYDPAAPQDVSAFSADLPDVGTNISSLLECRMCWRIYMEGITLDAGGVQQCAMRALSWAPTDYPAVPAIDSKGDDGSGGYYRDVHLTRAAANGFLSFGNRMGSERTWVNCRFTDQPIGHKLAQGNALNHSFLNCLFAGNTIGLYETQGGSGTVWACRFENNEMFDIAHLQSQLRIVGCHSISQNFCNVDGTLFSCTHDSTVPGYFWTPSIFHGGYATAYVPEPNATLYHVGTAASISSCKGNHSTNGVLYTNAGARFLHMIGNKFDNAAYMTDMYGGVWEDGVKKV